MPTNDISGKHVQQVAELVRRLTRDEINQLIRLVPQLQLERDVVADKRNELVKWAREQMARYEHEARPMQAENKFIGDTTVQTYFELPEAERERIWDELYAKAVQSVKEREVKPDVVPPAR